MKTNLNDPAARAAAAKQIASQAGVAQDPRDTLSQWDRDSFFAHASVQLRLPLRDPVEAGRHLGMIEQAARDLRLRLEKVPQGDRSALLMVQGVIRKLNQQLNAYRSPRT